MLLYMPQRAHIPQTEAEMLCWLGLVQTVSFTPISGDGSEHGPADTATTLIDIMEKFDPSFLWYREV